MAAKTNEKEVTVCPVAKCWMDFENRFGKKSKFVSHLNQSHIEV